MVEQHDTAVRLLYLCLRTSLTDTKDERGLSSVHRRVKAGAFSTLQEAEFLGQCRGRKLPPDGTEACTCASFLVRVQTRLQAYH